MFILDSLMISGLRWVMNTVVTAAEAEMNDDTALREQLLDAEMRREMGEISDAEFGALEADLLARIREIRERREGGAGPLSMAAQPIESTADGTFQIEASVSGDFHEPSGAPHTTIVESGPRSGEQISVLDMEPGQAEPKPDASLPLAPRRVKPGRVSSATSKRTAAGSTKRARQGTRRKASRRTLRAS